MAVNVSPAATRSVTVGAFTASGQTITAAFNSLFNAATVSISGTYSANLTFTFEVTDDGTNWYSILGTRIKNGETATSVTPSANELLLWKFNVTGINNFRVRSTSWGGASGSASIQITGSLYPAEPNQTIPLRIRDSGGAPGDISYQGGSTLAMPVQGLLAHDDADTGNPIKVGGRASTAVPSAVSADGDRVNSWYSRNGAQVVAVADLNGYASNGLTPSATVGSSGGNINVVRTTQTASVSNTSLVSAPGASLSIYVTDISVGNSGATLSTITLKDGTTAKFDFPCAALGGGAVTNLVTPWKLTANTALQYDTSAASTTLYITVNYYVGA